MRWRYQETRYGRGRNPFWQSQIGREGTETFHVHNATSPTPGYGPNPNLLLATQTRSSAWPCTRQPPTCTAFRLREQTKRPVEGRPRRSDLESCRCTLAPADY